MTRARVLLFYLIAFALSLLVAVVAAELVLRTMTFSTGDGGGKAARRWSSENWVPLNRQGFRDDEWPAPDGRPAVVFLGDSFTEGHGVVFGDTYYHRTREALGDRYVAYNIGRSGASTRAERALYARFLKESAVQPRDVVLQYFGNDMGDLLPPAPTWKAWPGLETLSEHSELADLLWVYMQGVRWGRLYADHHLQAYADPDVLARHRIDLHGLFDDIHASGARLVFVVFPFLDNEQYLDQSVQAYMGRMRSEFQSRCRAGDLFMDTAPLARALPLADRTVNRLDGHPSPLLHSLVADRLVDVLRRDPPADLQGFEACTQAAPASRAE